MNWDKRFFEKAPEHGIGIVSVTLGMNIHHAWCSRGRFSNISWSNRKTKSCKLYFFSFSSEYRCYPKPDSNAPPPSLFWDVLAESKYQQNKSMWNAWETASEGFALQSWARRIGYNACFSHQMHVTEYLKIPKIIILKLEAFEKKTLFLMYGGEKIPK